jgi:uncharacterized coiled-coil protein SlyX
MAGNRVEELEAKVRELEATIDGLTDELVETKERLQAVEEETGVETDVLAGRPSRSADADGRSKSPEDEPADGDGEASADDVNSDEAEGEDTADSESGDDIIVA